LREKNFGKYFYLLGKLFYFVETKRDMKIEHVCCDYCHRVVETNGKKIYNHNGFCLEIGYSLGGWGSRRDFIPKQSLILCEDCFVDVKAKVEELNQTIEFLKQLRSVHS
jgi:hypothetical protein